MWSWMGENYMVVVLDWERPMTLGLAQRQGDLFDEVTRFCDQALPEAWVYGLLHRERDRLFPDELVADLFSDQGCRSVPPSVVATVMVLQRLEGLSDREAVERYTFDARWRYGCGVGGYDRGGWAGSRTPCWSTWGNGCVVPTPRTGCSRWHWRPPSRQDWWGGAGCWTPPRCRTRWPPWTPSR
jgi:hypothetical protein